MLWATGLFVQLVRELRTTRYQFVSRFIVESSLTERTFGLTPSHLDAAFKQRAVKDPDPLPAIHIGGARANGFDGRGAYAMSKRSRFMTFVYAAAKSRTNFSRASALA